jgi:Cu+-exporting ATPase
VSQVAANEPTSSLAQHVQLPITGMTCASCAARIEKKLNRLDGVEASVNYATESASVQYDASRIEPSQLVDVIRATGYDATMPAVAGPPSASATTAAAGASPADTQLAALRQRLLVSTALAVPVAVLSMIPALQFDRWQWLALMLAAPVAVWGAWPFHRAAFQNARHGAATMDTLISLGVLAAFTWSLYALFFGSAGDPGMKMSMSFTIKRAESHAHGGSSGPHEIYLEVASAVTVFLLAGRYAEGRAKRQAGAALRALLDLGTKDVTILEPVGADGARREHRVPIEQLQPGMLFAVRPGERVATDGVVVEGSSAIDTSLLTGESVPVEVSPGADITGATVNAGGYLVARATRVGADTALAQLARLVEAAQSGKAPVQRLADRVSSVFVPFVIVASLATLAGWLLSGQSVSDAFTAAVAVMIIACPCALGLATPTALLVGTGRGAQLGIIIKGPHILESTRRVDTVVLDKTGTLTTGVMSVVAIHATADTDRARVLRLAGALEAASEHPVAAAIVKAARLELGPLPPVSGFASHSGRGVTGSVDQHRVTVGKPSFVLEAPVTMPAPLDEARVAAESSGRTVVVVAWDDAVRAVVVVADTPKESSAEAVAQLRSLGLTPMLLTGDNRATAHAVATLVGIAEDAVVAEVLPHDKVAVVARLQHEGRVVAMVGDGVNDAAALAQADLGIAMGAGSDVAIEASDLTLVTGDLRGAATAIRLSRRTLATIKGNLFWAFAYNIAAIPLAAAGLLNPLIAGATMALSSVFVVTNSLRLRRFR